MENKKIRVGNGKKMSETWLKSSVCIDTLKEHSFSYEGKLYAKVDINVYPSPNEHGKDVAIFIDNFKPKKQEVAVEESIQDLPF